MKIKIYQVDIERDKDRVCFLSLDYLKRQQITVNAAIYDKVFDGEVDCKDLEDVFRKFNTDHSADYRGRSMSVSDVVEVEDENPLFYYCDTIGFAQIDFDADKAEDAKNALCVAHEENSESNTRGKGGVAQ